MAERMYHGLTGWREEDDRHAATHMLLSMKEYEALCHERDKAIQDRKRIIKEANDYKAAAESQASADIADIRKKASEKILELCMRAEKAEAEAERQMDLNKNLLRITRERANAKRGLQPKKKHPGYRFSGKIMQTKTVSGHDKRNGTLYSEVWTATLETPYDATIPIHQIRDKIFVDLKCEDGILDKLHICYWLFEGRPELWKGSYEDAMKDNENKENYLFDYKFLANPKTNLWEIRIMTTKPIQALKEMM